MLGLNFSSKLDWGPDIVSIAKIASRIHSIKFPSPEVALCLCKSTISHAWNTVAMSGLRLLVAT